MNADPRYGDEVLRRFRSLSGAGDLPASASTVRGRAGDLEQGGEVLLAFAVSEGRVTDARFRVFGCPHMVAAASWLTERLQGARREDLQAWDWREVAEALDVPAAKFGRLLTLQDAVRDAARNWHGETRSTV